MPDTARWYAPNNRVLGDDGAYREYQGQPLSYSALQADGTYLETVDVPCRVDIARFFRSGVLIDQEITVNDFEMHVPYDFEPKADHRIAYSGKMYEVRKLMDIYSNPVTKLILITRLETIEKPLEQKP